VLNQKVLRADSDITYVYEGDGYVYADFQKSFKITPDSPDTPWSVTFKTSIKGCEENVTIDNTDYNSADKKS